MPTEPQIKLMSYQKRTILFKILFGIFIFALPFFIFYTTGYRLSFEEEGATFVTTGGIYVTTDVLEVEVYLNEERVERPRLFRSAYYIQNIEEGQHRVVVQGAGLQTWVKELPVDAHIVTEVAAFNMPESPIIRPIAEYVNDVGEQVFYSVDPEADLFPQATTTVPYVTTSTRSTAILSKNSEFAYVKDLFASSTEATTNASLINRIDRELQRFEIATTTIAGNASTTVIYPYIERGDMHIVDRGTDLYAVWTGQENNIPHYFCVTAQASSSVVVRYGEHVARQVEAQRLSLTDTLLIDGGRFCRNEIKLDRKRQDVLYYAFFPNSSDLVVLQLEDGLYVTEIDDRAWQNTQQIYSGTDFDVYVTDDAIYIMEDDRYFELITEIPEN